MFGEPSGVPVHKTQVETVGYFILTNHSLIRWIRIYYTLHEAMWGVVQRSYNFGKDNYAEDLKLTPPVCIVFAFPPASESINVYSVFFKSWSNHL